MNIETLILAPAVAPFTGALAVVAVVFVIEVILTLLAGTGFSNLVDALVSPDSLPDTSFTSWLLVREIPLLMVVLSFLAGFGTSGLVLQLAANQVLDQPLPLLLMLVPAALLGLGAVRMLALAFQKMRLVHTTALEPEAFIGQLATLSSPEARQGYSGSASFVDKYGHTHYVMVEPASPDETFSQGDKVVLELKASSSLYRASKAG